MWAFTGAVTAACNARLQPPAAHMVQVLGAAAQHQAVADAYAWGYNHPDRFWERVASPERAAAFLAATVAELQPLAVGAP